MYLVNRVLSVCSALFLLLFVMIAAHGHGSGDTNTLTGAIVVSVVAFSMAVLYFAAGRALAAGQKRHWLFHGGAWTLTLLVVLAML